MAIYRIFPEKDATLYSETPYSNTGKDEILEVSGYYTPDGGLFAARTLMQFSSEDIAYVTSSIVPSSSLYTASLHLYLAEANELPTNFVVYSYPVDGDWDEGRGKFNDVPRDISGVNWVFKKSDFRESWYITGSNTGSYPDQIPIGGTWFPSYQSYQSHSVNSTLDLNIDVTPTVNAFANNTLVNNGFILKLQKELEFQSSSLVRLRYFGKDTNTIFPPYLQFKWDDSTYSTGSLQVLNNDVANVNVKNNKGRYVDEGKQRFRISAAPTYPQRTFTTSSIYLTNYALPEDSYWGLKDENSEEMIVDFDTIGTKISCDENGSYFDVYMNGLQPERYYRILIKTTLDGSTTVINQKNIFKIVRNG